MMSKRSIHHEELSTLELLMEFGVDEAIGDIPINRFDHGNQIEKNKYSIFSGDLTGVTKDKFDQKTVSHKSIEKANKPSVADLIQSADIAAKSSKSIAELISQLENFTSISGFYKSENKCSARGSTSADIMVFLDSKKFQKDSTGIELQKSILFDGIFDSIGFNTNSKGSLYAVFSFPLPLEQLIIDRKEANSIIRPFFKRYIELVNPKFVVVMGKYLGEILDDKNKMISQTVVTLKQFKCIEIPSLEVLLRAPERKRSVWQNLLSLKHEFLNVGISDD